MSPAEVEDFVYPDSPLSASVLIEGVLTRSHGRESNRLGARDVRVERSAQPRRSPRMSLIVVLPDNHAVPAEAVTQRLLSESDRNEVDVIVACAGRPKNLESLQRKVPDLQLVLAPAGTSTEDLRELAMMRAGGDIVTLLSGFLPEREDG